MPEFDLTSQQRRRKQPIVQSTLALDLDLRPAEASWVAKFSENVLFTPPYPWRAGLLCTLVINNNSSSLDDRAEACSLRFPRSCELSDISVYPADDLQTACRVRARAFCLIIIALCSWEDFCRFEASDIIPSTRPSLRRWAFYHLHWRHCSYSITF